MLASLRFSPLVPEVIIDAWWQGDRFAIGDRFEQARRLPLARFNETERIFVYLPWYTTNQIGGSQCLATERFSRSFV